MTPAEILTKLIEMARAQGYACNNHHNDPWEAEEILNGTIYEHWGVQIAAPSLEEIIFDFSFIQALCKAKYSSIQPDDSMIVGGPYGTSTIWPWKHQISALAIAPDRLKYLADEFLARR